ncbi:MAG TPA: FAD-binding oxidoreductase [Rhodobacteraceae bacterium]|jgi:decaprenylphospho-beta-D-ribofuranose 2-oxidase|nr:FAD-binding oxidoreductase [Rhodobacter sp.]HBN31707.1 FAD-binding oxidoreductase [Paracoccaceae bacterium]
MRWKTAEYTGWGRVLKATGDMARPERVSALKSLWADSKGPAIGNRRSYGDVCLNDKGRAIDMTRLNRMVAFDPLTGILEAEAGITLGEITQVFATKGWIPHVVPGTGFVTLGGAIANDVHGKNHHGAGSFGQYVNRINLLGANGKTRIVTPCDTPDLFKATIGGLGQTGVILSAEIQLKPCASAIMDVRENRAEGLDEFLAMLDRSTATYCVGWIDATAKGSTLGRGILEEAEIRDHTVQAKLSRAKSVPRDAPSFAMSAPLVRLFNALYYRRVPQDGRRLDRPMQDFFFPLDRIHNVNRLYGKNGFHQFQCVLPDATAREGLAEMLRAISKAGLASPLAVIKKMGPGRAGFMSFPMQGYTLAVDFQNRPRAAGLIADLEEITLKSGGRIYLAKDALTRADSIAEMYDELPDFTRVVNAADPKGVFLTDMVRRLKLRKIKP